MCCDRVRNRGNFRMLVKFVGFILLCGVVATSGFPQIQNAESQYRVPGEYHVVLKPALAKTDISSYVDGTAQKIKDISEKITIARTFIFSKLIVLVVHCDDEANVYKIFDLPEVKDIEANLKQAATAQSCVNQDAGSYLWGLSRISSQSLPDYNGATYGYDSSDGSGVYVYVVDTGINIRNLDFNGRATHGYTAQNLANSEGSDDLNGHGTHCSGTVMSTTYGVAKSAISIAVKVIDQYQFYTGTDFLDGVNWMFNDFVDKVNSQGDRFMAVASMSLGGGASSTNDAAVQECIDAGLPVIAAAGNENTDACSQSPARMADVVTVGATDNNDNLASFSNWGSCVTILGPGVDIVSTFRGSTTATATLSGTSMATPHVTGTVARYMSQLGHRPTPASVHNWLKTLATADVCDLRGMTTTPNLLLYAPCTLVVKGGSKMNGSNLVRHHPDNHPDNHPDHHPDNHPDHRPDHHPDNHPDHHPEHHPDHKPGSEQSQCPSLNEWSEMRQRMQVLYNIVFITFVLLVVTFIVSLLLCCSTIADAKTVRTAHDRWSVSSMTHDVNKASSFY